MALLLFLAAASLQSLTGEAPIGRNRPAVHSIITNEVQKNDSALPVLSGPKEAPILITDGVSTSDFTNPSLTESSQHSKNRSDVPPTIWVKGSNVATEMTDTLSEVPVDLGIDWYIPPKGIKSPLPSFLRREYIAGTGTFAWVLKAKDLELHRSVAVKVIFKRAVARLLRNYERTVEKEIFVLSKLPVHPSLPKYIRHIDLPDRLLIETDFAAGQPIDKAFNNTKLDEGTARSIMKQVLDGLLALHKAGIYHLDVKPGNIMYDVKTKQVKLIDYGLARTNAKSVAISLENPFGGGDVDIALSNHFTPASLDVWEFGSTLYQMVSGACPYRDFAKVPFSEVINKKRYKVMPHITDEVLGLIELEAVEYRKLKVKHLPISSFIIARLDVINRSFRMNRFWSDSLKDLFRKIFVPGNQRISLEDVSKHPWFQTSL